MSPFPVACRCWKWSLFPFPAFSWCNRAISTSRRTLDETVRLWDVNIFEFSKLKALCLRRSRWKSKRLRIMFAILQMEATKSTGMYLRGSKGWCWCRGWFDRPSWMQRIPAEVARHWFCSWPLEFGWVCCRIPRPRTRYSRRKLSLQCAARAEHSCRNSTAD